VSKRPIYFASADALRRWFANNASTETELVVGYLKRATGAGGITWPESVDEALCVGWIDGLRKRVDERRYQIRFTPRKPRSNWSLINVRRVAALRRAGRMRPAGLAAYAARDQARTGLGSYEQKKPAKLSARELKILRANSTAWRYYRTLPPGYVRMVSWWILSAKRPETRTRRLQAFVAKCAARSRFTW
jgi:uncharacterized protein YdeI (YjbR/CyaY-like superfamily)